MEVLGFGLICTVLSTIGVKFLGKSVGEIFSSIIESAGGEAIEELLEKIISKIFPPSFFYLGKKSKVSHGMIERLSKTFEELTDEEKRELDEFFKRSSISKKYRKFELDPEEAPTNEINRLGKLAKESYKQFKSGLLDSVHCPGPEAAVKEIFGVENCPEGVLKVMTVVYDFVFERLFITLSADDRDVVKVVQYSINSRYYDTEKLLFSIKDTLDLIAQQNAYGVRLPRDGSAESIEAQLRELRVKDPFVMVKLKCECGATGSAVRRVGSAAYCSVCGAQYEIIRNVDEDEVKAAIKQAKEVLLDEIASTGRKITDDVSRAVTELAEKAAGAKFVEMKINELSSSNEALAELGYKRIEALTLSLRASTEENRRALADVNAEIKGLESTVSEQNKRLLSEYSSAVNAKISDEASRLSLEIRENNRKVIKALSDVNESLSREIASLGVTLGGEIGTLAAEIKLLAERLTAATTDRDKKREFSQMEQMVKLVEQYLKDGAMPQKRVCSACMLHDRTFVFDKNLSKYRCSYCGTLEKDALPKLTVKISNRVRIKPIQDSVTGDTSRVSLSLREWDVDAIINSIYDVRFEGAKDMQPQSLILIGVGCAALDARMLSKLAAAFPNLVEIVLGGSFHSPSRVDAPSGWSYNKDKSRLIRK